MVAMLNFLLAFASAQLSTTFMIVSALFLGLVWTFYPYFCYSRRKIASRFFPCVPVRS